MFHLLLPCAPEAVAAARRFIENVAHRLGVDEFVATLVASELVTNAVRHAGTGRDIELTVCANRSCWHVEVIDHAPTLRPKLPTPESFFALDSGDVTSGRGLPMIALMGGQLEVHLVGRDRKAVSATLEYAACV